MQILVEVHEIGDICKESAKLDKPRLRRESRHPLAHLPQSVGVLHVGGLVRGELHGAVRVVEAGLLREARVRGAVHYGLDGVLGRSARRRNVKADSPCNGRNSLEPREPARERRQQSAAAKPGDNVATEASRDGTGIHAISKVVIIIIHLL